MKETETAGGIILGEISIWTICPVCNQKCHQDPGKGNPNVTEQDVTKVGREYVHRACAQDYRP